MRKNVEKLLFESGLSGHKIAKESGVPQSTVSRFLTGESKLDNMKLITAEMLNDYYKKLEEMKMTKEQAIAKLNELLGEDVTEEFEVQEEKSAVNGNMEFLVSNEKGLAVQVERNYDEVEDELTYTLNEEWAK